MKFSEIKQYDNIVIKNEYQSFNVVSIKQTQLGELVLLTSPENELNTFSIQDIKDVDDNKDVFIEYFNNVYEIKSITKNGFVELGNDKKITQNVLNEDDVEYIVFGFDDSDDLKIPFGYVDLFMKDFHTIFSKIGHRLLEMKVADDVHFRIYSGILHTDVTMVTSGGMYEYTRNVLSRLKDGYIVSITLLYKNKTKETYYVNWNSESEDENINQLTDIDKYGDFHIVINTKNIEEKEEQIQKKIRSSYESNYLHWLFMFPYTIC